MRRHLRAYLHSPKQGPQFLRFATIGIKMSLVDIGGVYLLPWLFGWDVISARVVSLSTALLVGYLGNRHFTFGKHRAGRFFSQLVGHFGVHLIGALINFLIFTWLVTLGRAHLEGGWALALLPLGALWIGGLVGLTFNFVVSRRFVFKAGISANLSDRLSSKKSRPFRPQPEGEG
ncbi:MAG: GtrA family protein [Opitutales bacterium]